jgi:hypothetical protein
MDLTKEYVNASSVHTDMHELNNPYTSNNNNSIKSDTNKQDNLQPRIIQSQMVDFATIIACVETELLTMNVIDDIKVLVHNHVMFFYLCLCVLMC